MVQLELIRGCQIFGPPKPDKRTLAKAIANNKPGRDLPLPWCCWQVAIAFRPLIRRCIKKYNVCQGHREDLEQDCTMSIASLCYSAWSKGKYVNATYLSMAVSQEIKRYIQMRNRIRLSNDLSYCDEDRYSPKWDLIR